MTIQKMSMTLLFAAVLLIPANALANSVDDYDTEQTTSHDNKLEPDHMDTANPMAQNIETNLTDLKAAHSEITNLMITQNESTLEQYTGPDIPFTMVYIDDDTLVVGLDPMAAYFDVPVEPEYIQFYLGIDAPVEVKYAEFQAESHSSQNRIKQWQDKYSDSCMPVKPAYVQVCKIYKSTMANLHIPLPTGTVTAPTPTPVTPTPASSTSPCVDSPKGSACYYYNQYKERCTDGKTYKRCNLYANAIKGAGYELPPDSGSTSPTPVTVPTYDLDNIRTVKSGSTITIHWDKPTDYTVERYKIYVSENNGSSYGRSTQVSSGTTSHTVYNVEEGNTYKVKIKIYYTNTHGGTSVAYQYSDSIVVPRTTPVCTDSQILQNNVCVDRCPANNKEWRNNMCTVVSCPAGQEIKNNACVDKPKPVTPVEPPVVTPPAVDKSQCISDSSRKSDTSCKDDYYLTRINDKSLSGGDLLGYDYIISGDDARYTGKGTITIGATKDGVVGLITAAHVLVPQRGHVPISQQIYEYGSGIRTDDVISNLTKVYSAEDYRGKKADAAYIPITSDHTILTDAIIDHKNQKINVVDRGSSGLSIHSPINLVNATHTTSGILNILNVTVRDNHHVVSNNQIIGQWPSTDGNSGAPIITPPKNGESTLVGLHVGKLCQYLSTENDQSSWYPNTCMPTLKVLSPWENIVEELGLDS